MMTTIIKPSRRPAWAAVSAATAAVLALSLATGASAQSAPAPNEPAASTQSATARTPQNASAAVAASTTLPQKDANGPGGSPLARGDRGRTFAPQFDRALTPQQMSDAWNRELNRLGLPSVNDSLATRYCCF